MANLKNQTIVSELSEKIKKARAVVLTDYRGLTHKQSEELHRAIKKAGGEFVVAKNSLLRIASTETNFPVTSADLSGPTAEVLAYEDEIAPLKELFKTIKTLGLPKVKFGFISGQRYTDSEIETVAKLPTKEVLQGQVVGRLNSPVYNLVYSLNYNVRQLAYVLSQIKK